MTQRRCPGCREWYDKRLGPCPTCEYPTDVYNPHLYTAKLNDHLFQQAESAEREKKIERAYRAGYDLDPPKWAKKKAREIVGDM